MHVSNCPWQICSCLRAYPLFQRFGYPVLISIDFDEFTSPFTPSFLFRLRRYIKHSRQCFIGYPNTSNFIKNTPLRVVFSTLFSVFGYPDETLSLVFDILLPLLCYKTDWLSPCIFCSHLFLFSNVLVLHVNCQVIKSYPLYFISIHSR